MRSRYFRAMRLADAVSLRSRKRKLRLFLDELQPTADTTVLDVGVDELGFGDGRRLRDAQLLRGALPVAGADHGARPPRRRPLPRALPGHPLRPGRRLRAAVRGRRLRRRLLERRDRARRRTRAAAPFVSRRSGSGAACSSPRRTAGSRSRCTRACRSCTGSPTPSRIACTARPGRSSRPRSTSSRAELRGALSRSGADRQPRPDAGGDRR